MGVLRRLTGRTLAERYLERGLYNLDKGAHDDAIADLVEAISLEPYNAELYTTRGFIYLESNNEDYLNYARADFEYALYLDPGQWVAEYCLGMITYAAEDYNEALRHFAVARDHAHLHPEIYYYRALCYYKLNDPDQAIREMDIALDLFVEQKDSRKRFAREWKAIFKQAQSTTFRPVTSGRPSVVGSAGYEPPQLSDPDDSR